MMKILKFFILCFSFIHSIALASLDLKDQISNLGNPPNHSKPADLPDDFSNFSDANYQAYVNYFSAINAEGVNHNEKANRINEWGSLAKISIIAFDKDLGFFFNNLHICSNLPNLKSGYSLTGYITRYGCGNGDSVRLFRKVKEDASGNESEELLAEKIYTDLLEKNSRVINKNYNPNIATIATDFLGDCIKPLQSIPYLDQVIKGLSELPKPIAILLQGKALYLSTTVGRSRTLHTSWDMPITTYLGLIPGVFLENRIPAQVNLISETLVHEIGHLIDHTVLRKNYIDTNGNQSIPYPQSWEFPNFQALLPERKQIFKENPAYQDQGGGIPKTTSGWISNYSEQDDDECFAEHFAHYIISGKREVFKTLAEKERDAGDNRLLEKFDFMKHMILTNP